MCKMDVQNGCAMWMEEERGEGWDGAAARTYLGCVVSRTRLCQEAAAVEVDVVLAVAATDGGAARREDAVEVERILWARRCDERRGSGGRGAAAAIDGWRRERRSGGKE